MEICSCDFKNIQNVSKGPNTSVTTCSSQAKRNQITFIIKCIIMHYHYNFSFSDPNMLLSITYVNPFLEGGANF